MKTKLTQTILVASMAGLCAQAHAAADGFNFYGLIDGGIANTKITNGGNSRTEFVTGGYAPNFVGMTGQKSIAGGVKGGFQLEQGFLLNSNACAPGCAASNSRFWFGPDSIFNRQANVYVEGNFGTTRLGTQPNIAFKSVLMSEPRFGSNYGSALAAIDIDGGLSTGDTAAMSYTSPSLSGFTLAGSIVSSQKATSTSNITSGSRLAGTYSAGPAFVTAAYYVNKTASAPATPNAKGDILGGGYKFGAFTLKGLYVKQKTAALTSLKTTGIGGSYDVNSALTLDTGVYTSKDSGAGYKMKTFGLGGQYKIIKDLSLYAQYAKVKNDATATTSFNFAGPTIQAGSITAGQSATTINFGALFAFF